VNTKCITRKIEEPQYPAQPLKTDASRAALPIPQSLALALSAHVAKRSAEGFVLVNEWGDQLAPWTLQRAIRTAREKVPGLPPDRSGSAEARLGEHEARHLRPPVA